MAAGCVYFGLSYRPAPLLVIVPVKLEAGNAYCPSRVVHAVRDDPGMLRVTLDTNAVDEEEIALIEAACRGRAMEIAHTTVTDREQQNTGYATVRKAIPETGVWDESRWGQFVCCGSIPEAAVLEESRLGFAALG